MGTMYATNVVWMPCVPILHACRRFGTVYTLEMSTQSAGKESFRAAIAALWRVRQEVECRFGLFMLPEPRG